MVATSLSIEVMAERETAEAAMEEEAVITAEAADALTVERKVICLANVQMAATEAAVEEVEEVVVAAVDASNVDKKDTFPEIVQKAVAALMEPVSTVAKRDISLVNVQKADVVEDLGVDIR